MKVEARAAAPLDRNSDTRLFSRVGRALLHDAAFRLWRGNLQARGTFGRHGARVGPPFAGGMASFFLGLNRGKLGISIDLKQPEGLEICLRLIDTMDVLVENFRPGAMDKLGLGFGDVRNEILA